MKIFQQNSISILYETRAVIESYVGWGNIPPKPPTQTDSAQVKLQVWI